MALQLAVVRVRNVQELGTPRTEGLDGLDNVVGPGRSKSILTLKPVQTGCVCAMKGYVEFQMQKM